MDKNGILIFFGGLILITASSIAAVHNFTAEQSLFSMASSPVSKTTPSPTPTPTPITSLTPTPSISPTQITLEGTISDISNDDNTTPSITIDTTTVYLNDQTQIVDEQGTPTSLSVGKSVTVIGTTTDGGMNASHITVITTP